MKTTKNVLSIRLFGIALAIVVSMAVSLTSCDDGSGTTDVPVTGITLNQSSISLTVGSSATLTATVAPDNATNKAVTWVTSNAAATVANGVITAVAAGTATITVTTKDGNKTDSCTVTVTGGSVQGTAPTITTATLPNGTAGTAYNQTLAATGDTPITWSVDNGTLPTGLSLAATGIISGTPATAGTSTFTVKATNAAGSGTKQLSITINSSAIPTVATPTASLSAGTYTTARTVTLSTATSGAAIYYTTDGTEPTTLSTLYSGAINIGVTTTIKAIAVKEGMNNSGILTAVYTLKAAQPTASPAAGTYTTTQNVTLTTTTADAQIYYTTNGTNPTTSSTLYSGAISISTTTTLKAIAVKDGWNNSDILTAAYTLNLPITLTENVWANGNITTTSNEQWFTFTATVNTQYIHAGVGTLESMYFRVYNSNGNPVGDEGYVNSYTGVKSFPLSVTVGQKYFIKVWPVNSWYTGTYKIGFSSSAFTLDAIPLTENVWADGNIPAESSEQWFKFTATASEQYIHVDFGTLKNLYVQVYDSSGATVGSLTFLDSNTLNTSRTLTVGQEYYIKVQSAYSPYIGTYNILFNTSSAEIVKLPTNAIPLAENVWANGNLPTSSDIQWFKFTATANTQYIHGNYGTLDYLNVQVYDSSGVTVGNQETIYYINTSTSWTITIGQVYYIKVWTQSSYSGTYQIAFNTSTTLPPPAITVTVPGADLAAKLAWLKSNAQSSTGYLVTVDKAESLAGTFGSSGDNDLYYTGKSNIIILLKGEQTVSLSSNGSLFRIGSDVTLILEQITLNGRDSNRASLVYVGSSGTFTMNDGEISGNTASSNTSGYGGGVYVDDGTFTMNGGKISGNTAKSSAYADPVYGGGVYVTGTNATFTMNGGEISDNTASSSHPALDYRSGSTAYGGGVYVGSGTFTMSGGKISCNTVSASGSWNYSSYSYGGGVYNCGTFTMSGGEISGNTASASFSANSPSSYSGYGGGVCMGSGGTFTKSGGTVTGYGDDTVNGNKAMSADAVQSDRGHAVYISNAKRRENTAGPTVNLDSTKAGAAGGWVD